MKTFLHRHLIHHGGEKEGWSSCTSEEIMSEYVHQNPITYIVMVSDALAAAGIRVAAVATTRETVVFKQ